VGVPVGLMFESATQLPGLSLRALNMQKSTIKAALIIATHGRSMMIEVLLDNLARCIFPPNVVIYIIENGPASGVKAICEVNALRDRVRYLHSEIAGKTVALNRAIHFADEEFLIFFDDDISVRTNIITRYIAAAERYGPGYFFGGPWVAEAETPCPTHLLPHLPLSARGSTLGWPEAEAELSRFDYFLGSNWAAFRVDLLRAGLFDEDLGPRPGKYSAVGDETELQRRLISLGVQPIYLPQAVIHHSVKAECYTIEWIRNRHFRHGITDRIISTKRGERAYELMGIPWCAIAMYVMQNVRLIVASLLRFSLERRTTFKMREAYWAGWLYGAWTRGK
jgi:GT2 family glycosyltransferase